MAETVKSVPWTELEEMKKNIDQLDGLLTDLDRLGGGMPVIEKNVRAMRSFVAVLQYGISDLVDVHNTE